MNIGCYHIKALIGKQVKILCGPAAVRCLSSLDTTGKLGRWTTFNSQAGRPAYIRCKTYFTEDWRCCVNRQL